MMKINDHVYMLDSTEGSHAYVILGEETMLVDTSLPGRGKKILEELERIHVKASDIKHILLTHHDGDHIGNAAMLEKATGATVWASAEDIPYIYGQKSRPGIKKYISMIMRITPPVKTQAYPADNRIGEVQVIATPGHTPGHVCLLYQDVLFAGDLVATSNGQIKPSPAMMTWDMPMLMQSIKKVAPLAFRWVCPAHGMPVERGDMLEKLG
jgi:glyoxylase-like metal-dependent hydrolase (beta-lactamase superfamily II)